MIFTGVYTDVAFFDITVYNEIIFLGFHIPLEERKRKE